MTAEPNRIAALIIQNKALLVVTGHNETIYWTPGGKMDEGEDQLEALKRELGEELGVTVESAEPYISMKTSSHTTGNPRTTHYYLVTIKGGLKPNNEIQGYHWYSKEDFEHRKPTVTKGITDVLVPKLTADGLL